MRGRYPLIGAKILELRSLLGVSRRDLARSVKCAPGTLTHWENGLCRPHTRYLVAFASLSPSQELKDFFSGLSMEAERGAEAGRGQIGLRLIKLRTALGVTQEQLAEKIGSSYRAVSSWELGRAKPIPPYCERLAQVSPTEEFRVFFNSAAKERADEQAVHLRAVATGRLNARFSEPPIYRMTFFQRLRWLFTGRTA